MSALARVLWEGGFKVTGSDICENQRIKALKALGIKIYLGHHPSNLGLAKTVVFSSAIESDNVELKTAQRRGIEIVSRLEMLSRLMEGKFSIGVAGTHGKTTTTAMIATLLQRSGLDPTFIIGAPTPCLGGNAKLGVDPILVAEIDESDGRFRKITPQIAVITNIGTDHLNNYKNEEAILVGFIDFVGGSERVILCADDERTKMIRKWVKNPLTFGIKDGDLQAKNIMINSFHTSFDLVFCGQVKGRIDLPAPGRHNVYNALAAMLACLEIGLDFGEMRAIWKDFTLPERRFQILREDSVIVVDDYAHLPEEISANLEAIREGCSPGRVVAVFQPHRFSRTKYINGGFGGAFDLADIVVVTDIYPAFEEPIPGVDAKIIVEAIRDRKKVKSVYYISKEKILPFLQKRMQPGDFIIGFGAGDIWKVTHRLAYERT
jgi:UDP-N-acetylmuramate--alanine ligase